MESQLSKQFLNEINRRLLSESLPRIEKCVEQLSDQELWYRPNENTVSIGNLILHLNGNVRQWVLSTLGKYKDDRKRQQEFDEVGPVNLHEMLSNLSQTLQQVEEILKSLSSDELTATYKVQGFEENGVSILIHVTEHFSYHVGQITYATKSLKNMDMGYYEGLNLDATD